MKRSFLLLLACVLAAPTLHAGVLPADIDRELAALRASSDATQAEPLRAIEGIVRAALRDQDLRAQLEIRLIDFLGSDAPLPAKQFVCKQLWIIGTDASLPPLQQLLQNPATAEIACYALRSNPSPRAAAILREALPQAADPDKARLIQVLGNRRELASVSLLIPLTAHANPNVALSATVALGQIGGTEAAQALAGLRSAVSPALQQTATQAYLQCAETLVEQGNRADARKIYQELLDRQESPLTRQAALLGLMRLGGRPALNQVVQVLRDDQTRLQATAIAQSHLLQGRRATPRLVALLPELNAANQVLLLQALAQRGGPEVAKAITALTDSGQSPVRVAALDALAAVGDASSVPLLVRALAQPREPEEAAAALRSLRQLQGPDVDPAILAALPEADSKIRPALIEVTTDRGMSNATTTLLAQTSQPDTAVRQAAFKALGKMAGPDLLPDLVESLVRQPDETALEDAGRAVVAVAKKTEDASLQTRALLAALAKEERPARKSALLEILGGIANEPALDALCQHLRSDQAQVRVTALRQMAAWPNARALPALEGLWSDTHQDPLSRTLALRGYLRLLSLPSDRPAQETLALFEKAQASASEPADQKLFLSSLAKLAHPGALPLAAGYLDNPAVAEEAAQAVVSIAQALTRTNQGAAAAVAPLKKAGQASQNSDLKKQVQELLQSLQ